MQYCSVVPGVVPPQQESAEQAQVRTALSRAEYAAQLVLEQGIVDVGTVDLFRGYVEFCEDSAAVPLVSSAEQRKRVQCVSMCVQCVQTKVPRQTCT